MRSFVRVLDMWHEYKKTPGFIKIAFVQDIAALDDFEYDKFCTKQLRRFLDRKDVYRSYAETERQMLSK